MQILILFGLQSKLNFQKEKTGWKIDVTAIIIGTSQTVEKEAQKAELTVPVYVERMMQLTEEQRRMIWTPLKAS